MKISLFIIIVVVLQVVGRFALLAISFVILGVDDAVGGKRRQVRKENKLQAKLIFERIFIEVISG